MIPTSLLAVSTEHRIIPAFGLVVFVALAIAMSTNRKLAMRQWRIMIWGLGLQLVFAWIVLKTDFGAAFFRFMNDFFVAIVNSTQSGAEFVFGALAIPFGEKSLGFFFAFNVLPTIIFFSSLSAVLYYFGILQAIVRAIAFVMQKTMGTSGAETLSASANIFLGQTEAPLVIRPYLPRMTNSEIMAVMTGGFATIAGGVMAAYIGFLSESIPNIAGHLLAASIMSAPAGLLFAKLMVPEEASPETAGDARIDIPQEYTSVLDAASGGASEGMKLAINVAAMLIAFLALIAMIDLGLAWVGGGVAWAHGEFFGGPASPFTPDKAFNLRYILGVLLKPLAWLMGIPWDECQKSGQILGVKTMANEFIAYVDLGALKGQISERTSVILSYALCGFSNLSSIGIQIGALSVLAPDRRADLVKLALPGMIAGSLACFSTACFAAMLT